MTTVDSRMAAGAVWMVLAKLLERSLGIISTLILARLLVPADFGLVAIATAIIAVLEVLTAFGFDMALIRDREATREHYDTAWTLQVALGCGIAALMVALAFPAAAFFADQRVAWVLVALALSPVIGGLENIGVVAFRKELNFRREFVFLGGKKLAMIATAIPLAVAMRNYWALVAGMVIGRFAATLLSYGMHPYRPRFSLTKRLELYAFSKWMLLINFINFIRLRVSDFVIGRMAGLSALGLYNVGFEIANLPTSELVAPINRAVYPGYSAMTGGLPALRQAYVSVLGIVALLALPAGAGIAAIAPILTPLALGDKWLDAIPAIELLAIYGMIMALQSNAFSIFLTLGVPRVLAILGASHAMLLVPALIFGTGRLGMVGAAWAALVTAAIMMPVNFIALLRTIGLDYRVLVASLWRPLVATGVMYLAVRAVVASWPAGSTLELAQANAVAVAAGMAVYALLITALWMVARRPAGAEAMVLDSTVAFFAKTAGKSST